MTQVTAPSIAYVATQVRGRPSGTTRFLMVLVLTGPICTDLVAGFFTDRHSD